MYQPTTRLLAALELLQSRDVVSNRDLSELLEVHPRTVRRYITSLQDLGIPVIGLRGRAGGYRLGPGRRLSPLILTDDQAVAVALGLVQLQRIGPAISPEAVGGALARLGRVLPTPLRAQVEGLERRVVIEPAAAASRPEAAIIARLALAADNGRRVWIRHVRFAGGATEREVDPYVLAVVLGHWYVAGWCHLRRAPRSFRIDRIVALEERAARFVPPPEFDALEAITTGIATMPAAHVAVVRFLAPIGEVASRIPPAFARVEPHGETTIARTPVDDLDAHARYVVGLGLPFEVVEPDALRAAVIRLAGELRRAARPTR